ncbi:hypothetical protein CBFG_03513 [Clostridiales bacterium 1_7_47FAA]|nr:hypothetical protein CBFG_03513 [Clostridiales bacterium 1_7_47FAA]
MIYYMLTTGNSSCVLACTCAAGKNKNGEAVSGKRKIKQAVCGLLRHEAAGTLPGFISYW